MSVRNLKFKNLYFILPALFVLLSACSTYHAEKNSNMPLTSISNKDLPDEAASQKKLKKVKKADDAFCKVQKGDLVRLEFSLYTADGRLLCSNIPALKDVKNADYSECYKDDIFSRPLEIIAGQPDLLPGLHTAVIGMETGESRKIILSPEEAYGLKQENKIKRLSSRRTFPISLKIPSDKFLEIYGTAPVEGRRLRLIPYVEHEIAAVKNDQVFLSADIQKPVASNDRFGITRVYPEKDTIHIELDPDIGSIFKMDNEDCRIVSKEDSYFSVDCNHPLAGLELLLRINIAEITKKTSAENWNITWFDNYDRGLDTASQEEKPSILVLHSSQCGWCRKLFEETMTDPRITRYRDNFIWIKVSEETSPEIMDVYGRKSYPAIIFLNSHGKEIEMVSGFKYAPVLRTELSRVLHIDKNSKKNSQVFD